MNKVDLIRRVAKRMRVTQGTVEAVANSLFEEMGDAIVVGEQVDVLGFGSFKRETRKAPGSDVRVPFVRFYACGEMKKRILEAGK